MGAKAAGKQPVAVGVMDDITRPGPAADKGPGHAFGPVVEVAPRIAYDRRLAGRSARCVHPNDGLARNSEQAKGIMIA